MMAGIRVLKFLCNFAADYGVPRAGDCPRPEKGSR